MSPPTQDRIPLGIVFVLTSALLMAMHDAVVKLLIDSVTIWQIYVVRSVLLLPVLLLVCLAWGDGRATFRFLLNPWVTLRSLLFMGMYFTVYSSIEFVPLSIVAAGLYTAPLFVVAITGLAGIERFNPPRVLAILIGFLGVLCILQPGAGDFSWMTLLPVFGGLFYGLVGIVTRTRCQGVSSPTIAVSLTLFVLATGLIGSGLIVFNAFSVQNAGTDFLTGHWGSFTPVTCVLLIALACMVFGNSLVLPTAYKLAPTTLIVTFDYAYLIFAALLGLVFFAEMPDPVSGLGIVLIICAGVFVTRT